MHNLRNYPCSVASCDNLALAKNLCNAHYIRERRGTDMSVPLHRKQTKKEKAAGGRTCEIEGCTQTHYGLSMCKIHYRRARWQMRKKELVEAFGNTCKDCKESFPSQVYDFHHKVPDNKKFTIGSDMVNVSKKALFSEAKKCDMLCSNCHRIRHRKDEHV